MSYQYSGLFDFKYQDETQRAPNLKWSDYDINTLKQLTKTELLALCETDACFFKLCNTTPVLYDMITSPN
jgi:hypothetical protein